MHCFTQKFIQICPTMTWCAKKQNPLVRSWCASSAMECWALTWWNPQEIYPIVNPLASLLNNCHCCMEAWVSAASLKQWLSGGISTSWEWSCLLSFLSSLMTFVGGSHWVAGRVCYLLEACENGDWHTVGACWMQAHSWKGLRAVLAKHCCVASTWELALSVWLRIWTGPA